MASLTSEKTPFLNLYFQVTFTKEMQEIQHNASVNELGVLVCSQRNKIEILMKVNEEKMIEATKKLF